MPHYQLPTPIGPQRTTRISRLSESPASSASPRSSRLSQSPAMKSSRKKKSPKKGSLMLEQPLSVLTQNYSVPLKDIAAWVTRPASERKAEVMNNNGRIARPMNSFMLYRSAYAQRVKTYCKEDNHQVVSKVTGASWQIEPKEVRELYERFAEMERENHQAAHPDYKFSPNKSGKKRIQDADDSSDDDDEEYDGSSRSAKRSRTAGRDSSRSHSSTPFEDMSGSPYAPRHGGAVAYHPIALHPSSYQASNPYGAEPRTYWHCGVPGRSCHVYHPGMEVNFGPLNELNLSTYDPGHRLVGLPQSSSQDLLGLQTGGVMHPSTSRYPSPTTASGYRVDPQLAEFDSSYHYPEYKDDRRQYAQMYAPPTTAVVPAPYMMMSQGQTPAQEQSHPSYQQHGQDSYHQIGGPLPHESASAMHPGMMTLTESPTTARGWIESPSTARGWTESALKTPDFNGEFPWA